MRRRGTIRITAVTALKIVLAFLTLCAFTVQASDARHVDSIQDCRPSREPVAFSVVQREGQTPLVE